MKENKIQFSGSIPESYDKHLGPMIFQDFASDLADLVVAENPKNILEVAAGTGILTAQLNMKLTNDAIIVATDLNDAMLSVAKEKFVGDKSVQLSLVDACKLPFDDDSFDAMVCQFGLMFFPDKMQALQEVQRVVKPGGLFVANVWGAIKDNDIVRIISEILIERLPNNQPKFYDIPYGMHNVASLSGLFSESGFHEFKIATYIEESRVDSAMAVADGFLRGTPLFAELVEMGGVDIPSICDSITEKVTEIFGDPPSGAMMKAHVISARINS